MARHTSYWKILGLDKAPEDRRTVKKAYAKKLRETRPDEDPEGFMRLREAHDRALNYVANLPPQSQDGIADLPAADPIKRDFTDVEIDIETENNIISDIEPVLEKEVKPPPAAPVEISSDLPESEFEPESYQADNQYRTFPLEDDLLALLDDEKKRYERDPWAALFKQAHHLDIDDFSDFEAGLLDALLGRSGYYNYTQDENDKQLSVTSQSIAASIFATLKWDETQLSSSQKAHQISWLREKLIKPRYAVSNDGVYIPETPTNFWFRNIWWIIIAFIIGLNFIRAIYD